MNFKALKSLEKYPLRLETGADCRILHGFGEKICSMIDQKLNVNKESIVSTKTFYKTMSMSNLDDRKKPNTIINYSDDENETTSPPKKQAKLNNETRKATKTITKTKSAEPRIFNNPTNNSMKPTTIATLLGINDSPAKTKPFQYKPIQILQPGSFHIVLCIDNAEASRPTQKTILEHLTKSSIDFDVRKLNIGDFLWIVRRKLLIKYVICLLRCFVVFSFIANDRSLKFEAILDYIVERKRLDDLSKSIIDGRYNEQKVNLNQNKIHLINAILDYIVSS